LHLVLLQDQFSSFVDVVDLLEVDAAVVVDLLEIDAAAAVVVVVVSEFPLEGNKTNQGIKWVNTII
jgi:hypothetical protein